MKEIADDFMDEKNRKVLTPNESWISDLSTFGHASQKKAYLPLENHYHKDKIEFVLVVQGTQSYAVDGKEFLLNGGDVFVSFPNEMHSSGTRPQMVNEILWFQIDLSDSKHFLGLSEQWGFHLYSTLVNFTLRTFSIEPALMKQFLEAFKELCKPTINQKAMGHSLFVYSLIRLLDTANQYTAFVDSHIQEVQLFIANHDTETLRMEDLAKRSGYSVSRFKQKFKEQVGVAPREYTNYLKVERAKTLLATTRSITDIALDLNFSTSNYFCVVFKQFTGLSPSAYRKAFFSKST